MKKIILILTVLFIGIQACDKIDDPIPADAGSSISGGGLDSTIEYIVDPSLAINNSTDLINLLSANSWDTLEGPDNSSQRFVILEEFTGHTCRACPDGARKIKQLVDTLGNQLIPIAIHATENFAAPQPNGNMYTTDFRVKGGHGEIYLQELNIQALPQGIVSRSTSSGRQINQWEGDINAIKNDAPKAIVSLKNYSTTNDTLVRVQVKIEWLETSSINYNLQVQLLESKVIDWQLDGSTNVPDYEHNFILRKVVNGTYGLPLQPAVVGNTETIEYITTYESAWNVNNMESVVFVFDSDPNNNYEVIQANSADFTP